MVFTNNTAIHQEGMCVIDFVYFGPLGYCGTFERNVRNKRIFHMRSRGPDQIVMHISVDLETWNTELLGANT